VNVLAWFAGQGPSPASLGDAVSNGFQASPGILRHNDLSDTLRVSGVQLQVSEDAGDAAFANPVAGIDEATVKVERDPETGALVMATLSGFVQERLRFVDMDVVNSRRGSNGTSDSAATATAPYQPLRSKEVGSLIETSDPRFVHPLDEPDVDPSLEAHATDGLERLVRVDVTLRPADGNKCGRCWQYDPTVPDVLPSSHDDDTVAVCLRCSDAMQIGGFEDDASSMEDGRQ